jgi:hypothetical protein
MRYLVMENQTGRHVSRRLSQLERGKNVKQVDTLSFRTEQTVAREISQQTPNLG